MKRVAEMRPGALFGLGGSRRSSSSLGIAAFPPSDRMNNRWPLGVMIQDPRDGSGGSAFSSTGGSGGTGGTSVRAIVSLYRVRATESRCGHWVTSEDGAPMVGLKVVLK